MTTPTTETKEFDPFDSASDPQIASYDLFGKVEISAWACALVKGQGKAPFDPAAHDRRFTAIDVFIQPLPEIDVKYPKSLEDHWIAEFAEWAKITLPSIKVLGIDNVRELNDKWVRVARVPNGKQYEKKDAQGNKTGQMADETTFKFMALFVDEVACRTAYLAAGGQPSGNGHNNPTPVAPTSENTEMATAYAFLKVIVGNAARGKATYAEAKDAVGLALAQYPTVAKFYTADSMETGQLITETTQLLPF
jgi:hypothetical protein